MRLHSTLAAALARLGLLALAAAEPAVGGLIAAPSAQGVTDGDALGLTKWLSKEILQFGIIVIEVVVCGGVGWYLFKEFKNAVERKDWSGFPVTLGGGVVVIGVVATLGVVGWNAIDDQAGSP